jgi:hypothetical protein
MCFEVAAHSDFVFGSNSWFNGNSITIPTIKPVTQMIAFKSPLNNEVINIKMEMQMGDICIKSSTSNAIFL